jgi:hypothetical protein
MYGCALQLLAAVLRGVKLHQAKVAYHLVCLLYLHLTSSSRTCQTHKSYIYANPMGRRVDIAVGSFETSTVCPPPTAQHFNPCIASLSRSPMCCSHQPLAHKAQSCLHMRLPSIITGQACLGGMERAAKSQVGVGEK